MKKRIQDFGPSTRRNPKGKKRRNGIKRTQKICLEAGPKKHVIRSGSGKKRTRKRGENGGAEWLRPER